MSFVYSTTATLAAFNSPDVTMVSDGRTQFGRESHLAFVFKQAWCTLAHR